MAKRNKAATKANDERPKKTGHSSANGPNSIAYESAKQGINASALARAAASEIFSAIGSRTDLNLATQANLMLNAIGKVTAIANAEMRWGNKKAVFFLTA